MGQGAYTRLPTLVAEELDARWDQVRAEGAPADAGRYNNLFWGQTQGTAAARPSPTLGNSCVRRGLLLGRCWWRLRPAASEFRLIGNPNLLRKDSAGKLVGRSPPSPEPLPAKRATRSRRWLPQTRLCGRGRGELQGDRRQDTGQATMDAGGRHPQRLVSPPVSAPVAGRSGLAGRSLVLGTSYRWPVHSIGH